MESGEDFNGVRSREYVSPAGRAIRTLVLVLIMELEYFLWSTFRVI